MSLVAGNIPGWRYIYQYTGLEIYLSFYHGHVIHPVAFKSSLARALAVVYWGNKEWLAVYYGEFEEARGWVILNNARTERVHYSESPTRVPLQIPIMHS